MLVAVLERRSCGVGEAVCGSAEGLDNVVDPFEGSVGASAVVGFPPVSWSHAL